MSSKSSPKASRPDPAFDRQFAGIVCGIDEAGRGPLAGPVFAACVHLPDDAWSHPFVRDLRDSKALTALRREILFGVICERTCYGIGDASVEEIDSLNILRATHLAMCRAYEAMRDRFGLRPSLLLIDGNQMPKAIEVPVQAVVKGDAISPSIAAASILAKVARDRVMAALHEAHPEYGWGDNAGYGTPDHLSALRRFGASPYHRRSFSPVRDVLGVESLGG